MALLKDLIVFGATNLVSDTFGNNIFANGFHHNDHDNDDHVLLAGGGHMAITELNPSTTNTLTGSTAKSTSTSTYNLSLTSTVNGVASTKSITKLWSSYIDLQDIRGTDWAPNHDNYPIKSIVAWFNQTGMPKSDTWYSGITVKGYSNDYASWQLAGYSSSNTTKDDNLYFRNGINSTWKAWKTILDSSNSSVSGTANSITVTINGHSETLTNTNTDTLVNQSQTTTSSWKPVILGYQSNATKGSTALYTSVTNVVYSTNVLQYQPSTGTLSTKILDLTVAAGTAPMTIASTTKIDNLNVDYLDGHHADYFQPALTTSQVGSTSKPIYWTGTTFAETTYSLNSNIISGTINTIAYYNTLNNISSATNIQSNGSYIHIINDRDVGGTAADTSAPFTIGTLTGTHIAMDGNEILAKTNATTPGTLYLQDTTGTVQVNGSGGLKVWDINIAAGATTDEAKRKISSASSLYLNSASSTSMIFQKNNSEMARFDTSGNFVPSATIVRNLGSSSLYWNAAFIDGKGNIHPNNIIKLSNQDIIATDINRGWPRILSNLDMNLIGKGSKLWGIQPDAVTVEITSDGTTWTENTSLTNAQKRSITNGVILNSTYSGVNGVPADAGSGNTISLSVGYGQRITLDFQKEHRYGYIECLLVYLYCRSQTCQLLIERYNTSSDTWTTIYNNSVTSTSTAYRIIYPKTTFYLIGNTSSSTASYANKLRFTFIITELSESPQRYGPHIGLVGGWGTGITSNSISSTYTSGRLFDITIAKYGVPYYIDNRDTGTVLMPVSKLYVYGVRGWAAANTDVYADLMIGNGDAKSSANQHAEGRIYLYSASTAPHMILGTSTSTTYTHTFPNAGGWIATGATAGVGSSTKPVYLSNSGVLTECSTMATSNHDHDDIYVKLDAGTNEQTIKNSIGSISNGSVEIWNAVASGYPMIGFANGTTKTKLGFLGFGATANVPMFRTTSGTMYKLAHEGNISDSTTSTLGTNDTTIATIAGKNITAKVDHVANNVTSTAGTNTTGNTITIPNITVNSAGHITNLGSHTHTIDSISWYKDESITISTAGKWYRIATLATTNQIRGSVTFFLYNAGGNYNAIWTKFSFDSGWVRGNANWIKIEGDTGIWDGLSITTNTNNIYINIHCISATSYGHLYVPTNAAIGASKNEDFTWHSGTLTQTPSSETLGSQFFVGNNTGIHITGTLSKTTSEDFNTPLISLCSPNLDSWLWRIKDRDTGTANATESVYGYGLKYIGTGADADNRLRLIADNQNETAVTAVSINQSGQIGIGTDSNSSYRVYVNGASMFKGIINIDSNSVGAGTHINFNRVGYNYINIPTDGKLTISVNGAQSANGRLQITSTAVTPGEISNYANAPTLGTTSYKWKALYVGSDASYGSDSQPVYWNNGVPKAITYTLLSGVKGGTANRMAWYESATSIAAAASIYASGTALAINSTSITSGYNFQVLGSSLMRLIAPQTTNTYDMGSTSLRWKSMYNVEEYIGTASGSQCHLNFDNTNKCLRFTFD